MIIVIFHCHKKIAQIKSVRPGFNADEKIASLRRKLLKDGNQLDEAITIVRERKRFAVVILG